MTNQAIAVQIGTQSISYEQMRCDIDACAQWIKARIPGHENQVALCLGNHYWHWVATLACLQIGKICASVYNATELPVAFKQSFQNWLVDEPDQAAGSQRVLTFLPDEVETLANQWKEDDTDPSLHSNAGLKIKFGAGAKRILFTSGTTGQVKAVGISGKQIRQRLEASGAQIAEGINSQTRMLTLMRPDTIGAFLVSFVTWLRAGTVMLPEPKVKGSGQIRLPIFTSNFIQMSPADLARLLQQVPGTWPGKHTRQIRIAGGRLHTRVRDEALERACAMMRSTYGATELGGIATCDALDLDNDLGLAGKLFSNVEVQVVDDADMLVPSGAEGWIRCKAPGMATGYEGLTASENFRHGWFYPGDVGSLTADGHLFINGRDRDVLNLGGHKVSALKLEGKILAEEGIQDVCVVPLDVEGVYLLGIAFVPAPDVDMDALLEKVNAAIGMKHKKFFVPVNQIPRNHMGKLMRAQVLDHVADAFSRTNTPDADSTSTSQKF